MNKKLVQANTYCRNYECRDMYIMGNKKFNVCKKYKNANVSYGEEHKNIQHNDKISNMRKIKRNMELEHNPKGVMRIVSLNVNGFSPAKIVKIESVKKKYIEQKVDRLLLN